MKAMRSGFTDQHWEPMDRELDEEHHNVLEFVRENVFDEEVEPPASVDRKIRALAAAKTGSDPGSEWILGQGPWVVLVICILFSIAMLFLL